MALIISEYVEGSSNNKAIELYNDGPTDILLTGYSIQMYFNGSASAGTTVALSGTIRAGGVFVLAENDAVAAILAEADQTNNASWYNGDDAIVLRGPGGVVLDSIGQVGFDPGSQWGAGLVSTADNTIRRKPGAAPDTIINDAYDPAAGWDGYATDTFDGLGSHAGGPSGPAVGVSDVTVDEAAGTATFTLTRSGGDAAFSVAYATADGTASAGADYTATSGVASFAAGQTTVTVTVPITADTVYEADETFTLNLSDATDGAVIADASAVATIRDDDIPATPVITVAATDSAATEGAPDGSVGFTFTREGDLSQALTVAYTVGGTATPGADHTGPAAGTITFAAGAATASVSFQAVDDTAVEPAETVRIDLADGAAYDLGAQSSATATIVSDDVAISLISTVQGAGAASGMVGQTVTIEAIVVGDFQNGDADANRNLGGFYLQEEGADVDGDALTSEGIFVFGGTGDVSVGDRVRVTGRVGENFGQTQITALSITVLDAGAVSDVSTMAAAISLPTAGVTTNQNGAYQPDLESYEGMLVTLPQQLVVTEQFNLDRFNEIKLYASEGDGLAGLVDEAVDGRPYQFTQTNDPDAAGYEAHQRAVGARTITYDDGLNQQNRPIESLDGYDPDDDGRPFDPAAGEPGYNTANAPQMGDTVSGLTGVLDYQWAGNSQSGSTWRVRSVEDGANTFDDANPREATPADVGGSLQVGSFNVLNFFVTLDAGGARMDNGEQPRGANTELEFQRQVEKLVNAIVVLDADILALMEIENDFSKPVDGAFTAEGYRAAGNAMGYLVTQLNEALGGDVYSYVDPGMDHLGTDAIAVGFIYKNDVVKIADDTVIAVDMNAINDRPTVAATFEEIATGGTFTAVANHFKSKGGGGGDIGDGQGDSNARREAQAEQLADWLVGDGSTGPTGAGDADYLLLGDFNAYYQEDPIDVLREAGYSVIGGPTSYSYTFDGQLGSLDHVIANGSLLEQVTGSTKWHINSDEADALDYNLDSSRDRDYFDGSTPYRVSDHDPILVGLDLRVAPVAADGAATTDEDTVLQGSVQATDGNGDALTYSLVAGPANGTLQFNADGTYVYTPNADYNGTDGFTFSASDGREADDGAVTLTVTPVNDAPVARPDAASVREDATLSIPVLGNDTDVDHATLDVVLAGTKSKLGASISVVDGEVVYTADADAFDLLPAGGSVVDEFTYRAVDGDGALSAPVTVHVTVREGGDGRTVSGTNKGDLFTDSLGEADTTWRGGNGDDTAFGNGGADVLYGENGSDTLWGGAGADVLDGGNGRDFLFGGDGDDVLVGGHGGDLLTGGAGRDTFVLARGSGPDNIVDFNADEDSIVYTDTKGGEARHQPDFLIGGGYGVDLDALAGLPTGDYWLL